MFLCGARHLCNGSKHTNVFEAALYKQTLWHRHREMKAFLAVLSLEAYSEGAMFSSFINNNTVLPPPIEASGVDECYVMPLGAAFMPLCGNGHIDLLTDYVAYFGTIARQRMRVAKKYVVSGSTSS